MTHSYGLDIPDDLYDQIEESRDKGQWKNDWIFGAVRMRLELEEAIEAAGMAGEIDDDWWRDWLYDAAREELHEQWADEAVEERDNDGQEIEAD